MTSSCASCLFGGWAGVGATTYLFPVGVAVHCWDCFGRLDLYLLGASTRRRYLLLLWHTSPKKSARGRRLFQVFLSPEGASFFVSSAGPWTGLLDYLSQGKLAGLVHCKTFGAQENRTHIVKRVRGMEPEPTNVLQRLVRTMLCLQPSEHLLWVDLLDEQRTNRAFEGVVRRVGVGPGEPVPVHMLRG